MDNQAYREEGNKARTNGAVKNSNPYAPNTEAAALWDEGYDNAGRCVPTAGGFKINFGF